LKLLPNCKNAAGQTHTHTHAHTELWWIPSTLKKKKYAKSLNKISIKPMGSASFCCRRG